LLSELESQLGFRLLERATRNVTRTAFGSNFMPIADCNQRELEYGNAHGHKVSAPDAPGRQCGSRPSPLRNCDGLVPKWARKLTEKWLGFLNPHSGAIAETGAALIFSSNAALSSRCSSTYW